LESDDPKAISFENWPRLCRIADQPRLEPNAYFALATQVTQGGKYGSARRPRSAIGSLLFFRPPGAFHEAGAIARNAVGADGEAGKK
jgi:hypothetical protein